MLPLMMQVGKSVLIKSVGDNTIFLSINEAITI